MSGDAELRAMADAAEAAIEAGRLRFVRRVVTVRETASTQGAARRLAEPGTLVAAGRQTAGRGRLGRRWADEAGMGVAATLILDAGGHASGAVSLAAGLAAAAAVEAAIAGAPGAPSVGVRWPNDVVERAAGGGGRKFAGVLVERADGLLLVGIGVNVTQRDADFEEPVRARAVSTGMCGSAWGRPEVLGRLCLELDRTLGLDGGSARTEWEAMDVLLHTRRIFEHDGRRVEGVVVAIDPSSAVRVRLLDGGEVSLPALTTSLIPIGG